jgi:hypothetical protein
MGTSAFISKLRRIWSKLRGIWNLLLNILDNSSPGDTSHHGHGGQGPEAMGTEAMGAAAMGAAATEAVAATGAAAATGANAELPPSMVESNKQVVTRMAADSPE